MPRLCICFLTYTGGPDLRRFEWACRSLDTALHYIECSLPMHVHIAHDGSPIEHITELTEIVKMRGLQNPSVTNSERRGYGASYNAATLHTHEFEYILPLEDDWELVRSLDIDTFISWLDGSGAHGVDEGRTFNSIRMGYLGSTQPVHGTVIHGTGGSMLHLDASSYELHVFSGHPRLDTREYQRRIGFWPEGLTPGETEINVAQRKAAREGILWPMDWTTTYPGDIFRHIGEVKSSSEGLKTNLVNV
jgi:hypothetical protein